MILDFEARRGSSSFSIPLLKRIISNGFDPNQKVGACTTILMMFVDRNLGECVRYMWEVCDLNVHATDSDGFGIMHYAHQCDLDFLKFMVNTMAVPYNIISKDGRNILWTSDWSSIKNLKKHEFYFFQA